METSVVDRQCCYQSQGCPLIIMNAVVEAKLLLKRRSEGFGKGKKRRRHQREHTAEVMCFLPSVSFVVKLTAYRVHMRELTVIDSVLMYGLLLVGGGQTWPHYGLHR